MASPIYLKSSDSCKFNAVLGNARTFAVGKDNGLEFYRKIFGLGPPTLQIPRRPCSPCWFVKSPCKEQMQ